MSARVPPPRVFKTLDLATFQEMKRALFTLHFLVFSLDRTRIREEVLMKSYNAIAFVHSFSKKFVMSWEQNGPQQWDDPGPPSKTRCEESY